ncbi:CLUMA_CG021460, isoform A [Clunio marinus]|uniref:CLUMA_CG021460, isoform A n=1 Tax=Clunio marinus TaxID=568069 RepID=A0A1J1J8S4_9DIPT|nr:CLUMA_CG021460, isoform A [Clunio marinus]
MVLSENYVRLNPRNAQKKTISLLVSTARNEELFKIQSSDKKCAQLVQAKISAKNNFRGKPE